MSNMKIQKLLLLCLFFATTAAFSPSSSLLPRSIGRPVVLFKQHQTQQQQQQQLCNHHFSLCATSRKTKVLTTEFDHDNEDDDEQRQRLNRRHVYDNNDNDEEQLSDDNSSSRTASSSVTAAAAAVTALVVSTTTLAQSALAASSSNAGFGISQGMLDPQTFVPVCPASDGFYRFLQSSTVAVVGRDAFTEYGPLIAGGLLRVRLELCVVESFLNEAVIPFVKQNGVSWILPFHETVETFIAGVIFALATTFILIGSTKILTVIITYTDFLVGFPFRVLGGFVYDRSVGKPVTLDIGLGPFKTRVIGPPETIGPIKQATLEELGVGGLLVAVLFGAVKFAGQIVGFIRDSLDALDTFVGKYLVFWASLYILIKFLHFKIFPDFP